MMTPSPPSFRFCEALEAMAPGHTSSYSMLEAMYFEVNADGSETDKLIGSIVL